MDNGTLQHANAQDRTMERNYSPTNANLPIEMSHSSQFGSNQLTRSEAMDATREFRKFSRKFPVRSPEMEGTNPFLSHIPADKNRSFNALPGIFPLAISTVPINFSVGNEMHHLEKNSNVNCFQDEAEDLIARHSHFLPKSALDRSLSPQQRDSQVKRRFESDFEGALNNSGYQENREHDISVSGNGPMPSSDSSDSTRRVQQGEVYPANGQSRSPNEFREDEETYRKKRDKNNAAAKRSRDKKKVMEHQLQIVAEHLFRKCAEQDRIYKELASALTALQQKYDSVQLEIQKNNLALIKQLEVSKKSGCAICKKPLL